jgi:ankyrin repeat protein
MRYDRVVEFLLEKKAHVNAQNDQKETPLHLAFGNGHMEIIRLLMQVLVYEALSC